jgi:hypothetical protein
MRSKLTVALIVVAIFLLGAGSPPSASAAPADDACALLTQAQVSAALGVSFGAGKGVVPVKPKMCVWSRPYAPNTPDKRAMLTLLSVNVFTHGKVEMKGFTYTTLSGVGDDAYYVTGPGFGAALYVKKGSSVFQIKVNGFPVEQVKTIEKTLALQALAKL